jgi:hypothetical protein
MRPPKRLPSAVQPRLALAVTEAQWQTTVLQIARLRGWRVAHFRPARTERGWRTPVAADGAGFPDLVLIRDRVVFAELKSRTGRVSPGQHVWLDALEHAGAEAYIWRPSDLDEVQAVLR